MPSDKTSSSKPRAVAAHGSSSGSGSTRTPARASTTSPSLSWKVPLALLVILMASSFTFIRDAIIDMGILLGTPPAINTEGCKPVGQLEACEDIYIHHASGLAFTACGRAETRKSWFPPVGKRNHSTVASAFEDNFVIYDLANGQHRIVEIDEFPKNTDRVFTGLDVYLRSENELTIFLVNHRRTGSVIEILEYTIGDERIQYKETISHELIRAPNDILAMSPRSFYVTNDHLHINGTFRMVEEFVRRPWSDLVYYSPEQTKVVYSGVISANGLAANSDKSEIYMTACHGAGFYILRPGGSHDPTVLELEAFLKLDYYVDNPTYDPTTDSVFIAGHLQPLKFVAGLEVPHVRLAGPSKVIKISKNSLKHQQEQLSHQHSLVDTLKKALTNRGPEPGNRYHVETVIQDDGGLISTSATAAIDRKNGVVLIAAVLSEQGLIRCPLPKGF